MLNFTIKTNPTTQAKWLETSLSGKPLLTTPQLNKGTAFSKEERHHFELTGKLPIHIESLETQCERSFLQYQSYDSPLQKNIYLNKLHDTNQVLFYKLLQQHAAEMIPIIYTPTVGIAVEKFSREFQQARGLYISYEDRHIIEEILDNRSNPEIDLIVASDGGGVLGIGDQGIGAMLIPVAKLMVYSICGGINPLRTLPILLDAGTDNEALLQDPFYLGSRHGRISGEQYDEFIELFIRAVKKKFPKVFLHWEDFGRDNARRILQNYQHQICSFNDDIQGTGATTLAALLAAVKSTQSTLEQQRIIIFGGGNAGTGIADQLFDAIVRTGVAPQDARSRFWIIDKHGLLIDTMQDLTPAQKPFARPASDVAHWPSGGKAEISLLEVIKQVQPTVLIGCSARGGAFTQEIIETMASLVAQPIIFPLSNPTEKAEATPQDVLNWTQGQALIACGSPFPPVSFQGETRRIAQCNNALIFPGMGLGVIAVKANRVTDNMLWAACEALNRCAPIHDDPHAPLLPSIDQAHQSARDIAIAVATQALADGVATMPSGATIISCVDSQYWFPEYLPFHRVDG
ncbi:MAG TPA: NAD-dependent malic enzyme [Gammaproteobacteria bacterium]|nr:NAD-dependent malic enzyme [Gammaproteobacteria bacterium]